MLSGLATSLKIKIQSEKDNQSLLNQILNFAKICLTSKRIFPVVHRSHTREIDVSFLENVPDCTNFARLLS